MYWIYVLCFEIDIDSCDDCFDNNQNKIIPICKEISEDL